MEQVETEKNKRREKEEKVTIRKVRGAAKEEALENKKDKFETKKSWS